MTSSEAQSSAPLTNSARPLLLLFFFGSGCAALIYEIVWFQMLSLIIGSSSVSMGVLLGTFMGGMCLGSLYAPKWISSRRHPLRVYAALELAIGAIGLLLGFLWAIAGFFFALNVGDAAIMIPYSIMGLLLAIFVRV